MRDLDIHPLTSGRIADLASLFDQGGDPKWCWCAYFRVRGLDWSNSTRDRNRETLERAVRDNAAEGRAPGLIAYRQGVAVGWVSLAPRGDFERLEHSRVLAAVDDRPVWSIVCFVVARPSRGIGVAKALLAAAVDYARDHGARILEAYPVDTSDGRRVSAANAYHGTLSMFTRAGFRVVARRQSTPGAADRPIVRRAVRSRRASPRPASARSQDSDKAR